MAGVGNGYHDGRHMQLVSYEQRGNPPSEPPSFAAEKIVYVAVGREPKDNESTLLWAIQNFGGWKICILHVHQPADLAPLFGDILEEDGVGAYRERERKIMQKKLDDYLHICSDFGVRTQKVHVEMDSAEEGLLYLIEIHKIKRLVMGVDKDFNIVNSKSRKTKYVKSYAPPFCTMYIICNGHLIFKRGAGIVNLSIENGQPSSSKTCQSAKTEVVCEARALDNSHEDELRMRLVLEQELEKTKQDLEKVTIEAQDQKRISEHKILAQEQKIKEMQENLDLNSGLLRLREQERDDLAEELSNRLLQPRTESFNFLSTLSYPEIVEATCGLDPSMRLKETEHGSLFKGSLYSTPVTVRLFFSDDLFKQEVEVLSRYRHPNLGDIVGACQNASTVVYEHLPNESLEERLTYTNRTPPLSWQGRVRIAAELCSALIFLHNSRPLSVIHCALQPSCIFLDSHFSCKLIGFEFSHTISHDESSGSTSSNQAISLHPSGYADPEFIDTREVSPEVDVYSYGVILLQLLTGMPAIGLVDEVRQVFYEDQLETLLDNAAGEWPFLLGRELAELALKCCDPDSSVRPDLKSEVWTVMKPMAASCQSALTFMLDEPPSYFLCPISYEIMRDPCVAADGHTYETEVLRQWLDGGHNTSPMTNIPFTHNHLIPNLPLRSAIQEWLQRQ